jgi:hypothetical protein
MREIMQMDQVNQPTQEVVAEVKPTEVIQPTTPVEPSKESEEFKANFERIKKQEDFQSTQRKKLEAERKEIEAERAEAAEFKRIKQLKSEDPLKVLESLGLSVEDIVRAASNPKNIDPVAAKALEAVEKLQAEIKARDDAIQNSKIQKMEKQLQSEILTEVKKGEFDIVDSLELHGEVREYMEAVYNRTGEVLTVAEAAKAVNDYYATQIKKVMGSKWLKEQIVETPVAEQTKAVDTTPTLSNKMTSESPKTVKPMNDSERIAAAIKAMGNIR